MDGVGGFVMGLDCLWDFVFIFYHCKGMVLLFVACDYNCLWSLLGIYSIGTILLIRL